MAWVGVRTARAAMRDAASAGAASALIDVVAFGLAAWLASHRSLGRWKLLALLGPPTAVIVFALELPPCASLRFETPWPSGLPPSPPRRIRVLSQRFTRVLERSNALVPKSESCAHGERRFARDVERTRGPGVDRCSVARRAIAASALIFVVVSEGLIASAAPTATPTATPTPTPTPTATATATPAATATATPEISLPLGLAVVALPGAAAAAWALASSVYATPSLRPGGLSDAEAHVPAGRPPPSDSPTGLRDLAEMVSALRWRRRAHSKPAQRPCPPFRDPWARRRSSRRRRCERPRAARRHGGLRRRD